MEKYVIVEKNTFDITKYNCSALTDYYRIIDAVSNPLLERNLRL